MAPAKEKWIRRFIIPETMRHKNGFTVYKVTSVVYLKNSCEEISKVSVWKRYNDFKKLYSELHCLHTEFQIKESFPSFPRSRFFGRFETEVIEERKKCALKLLEFVGRHPCLYSSNTFITFFETSHISNCINDCSQSISSDTSEEDHSTDVCNDVKNSGLPRNTSHLSKSTFVNKNCVTKIERNKLNMQYKTIIEMNSTTEENKTSGVITKSETPNSLSKHDTTAVQIPTSISVHDGSDLTTEEGNTEYILIAAAHMSAGFRHEAIAEYEEAFMQYKLGISNLLAGIQFDSNTTRVAIIKEKISQYLSRAEKLYNKHLNCNVSLLSRPVSELKNYKVLKLMKTLMLARDICLNHIRIVKTIEKLPENNNDLSNYILYGQIPYMVRLYACIETDTTIFLILQYVRQGNLWSFLESGCRSWDKLPLLKEQSYLINHKDSIISNNVRQTQTRMMLHVTSNSENEESIKIRPMEDLQDMTEESDNVPTKQLVERAQKLLQSVNATLHQSNSVTSRLSDCQQLRCYSDTLEGVQKTIDLPPAFNVVLTESNKNNFTQRSMQSDLLIKGAEDIKFSISNCGIVNGNKNSNVGENHSLKKSSTENNNIGFHYCQNGNDRKRGQMKMWNISEDVTRIWAAEILLALEALHQQDVIVMDFNPSNILLDDTGHVLLTYIIPHRNRVLSKFKKPYSSPEMCMFLPTISITPAADVWSFGVILYELLTGMMFKWKHPGSFHSHSIVSIPSQVSKNATSLLLNILKYEPNERLTVPEVKQHPFFADVDWSSLMNTCPD